MKYGETMSTLWRAAVAALRCGDAGNLVGRVGEDAGTRIGLGQPAAVELARDGRMTEHVEIALRHVRGGAAHELVEAGARRLGGARGQAPGHERSDGVDVRAVPVGVEHGREFAHHRARGEHVEIDEVRVRAAHEVLVGDVAPAGDREGVVRHEQLVVHAVVDAIELVHRPQQPRREAAAARGERIEDAHLGVRGRGQAGVELVLARGVEIVDEQAHAHAARRGVAQLTQELLADIVVLHEVVLRIDRLLGTPDQRHTRAESRLALGQKAETREAARVRGCCAIEDARQARVGHVGDRVALGSGRALRQAGASADAQQRQDQRRPRAQRRAAGLQRQHDEQPTWRQWTP